MTDAFADMPEMDGTSAAEQLAGLDQPVGDPLPGEPATELGYAKRLIAQYGDQLRYVPAWRKWLVWSGDHWSMDTTGLANRYAKIMSRTMTNGAMFAENKAALRVAYKMESSHAIAGILNLACTESGIACTPDDLDADPYLLNCRNGTVDLRTGELRPHDRADLITKITAAEYDRTSTSETFDRFLERIQPDPAMRCYLARLLGHALAGKVTEHVLPILWGSGANGKSTLVDLVVAVLGDYAAPADADLLTAKTFDAHPTGVADLFGLRLAVLHEGDAGRRLAEGTVKRLTGGDRVKARRMREDFWWFEPSHTFAMLTNHKPVIAGTDDGIWRRVRLVPFEVKIPDEEKDGTLGDRLLLSAAAVLAWLIDGYNDWAENGLDDPEKVTQATAAYRAESDAVGRFIEERCLVAAGFRIRSAELYGAYTKWCSGEGIEPLTQTAFSTELSNRGFDKVRTNVGAMWKGVGLAADDDE